MGYGIIRVEGNRIEILAMDVLKINHKKDSYERLQLIHHRVCELIRTYQPHHFAIEAPFFGKNIQSMLKLGRAQGVAIAAAMQAGVDVTEYSPKKVKQSVTGNGNADKEQVLKMLEHITSLRIETKYFDASDALAVAICHHFQTNSSVSSGTKKVKDWNAFIKENPSRIR